MIRDYEVYHGVYVKFSKKRITPWQFTFNSGHYNDILSLVKVNMKVFIVLVCGMDGICCIDFQMAKLNLFLPRDLRISNTRYQLQMAKLNISLLIQNFLFCKQLGFNQCELRKQI